MTWSNQPWSPFGWSTTTRRGFSPAQLTSLRGWWKSDAGVTIATGVSSWLDQSGNGNTLLQATGAAQPALTAGAINGLPALTFDGTDDSMRAVFTLVQPETIFIVMSQVSHAQFDMMFDGSTTTNVMSLQQTVATPGMAIRAGTLVATNTNLAIGTFGLVTAIFNGASSVLQVNNTTETTGNAGALDGAGLRLGTRGDAGGNFGNVQIAEVIVMGAVATAAERASMKAYVLARYAIS